jgi:hypothetical protein
MNLLVFVNHGPAARDQEQTGMRFTNLLVSTISLTAILIPGPWLLTPANAQSPGNFSTLSTTGAATLNGDVMMCSGHPWIDVRCNGAIGDGSHDDTTAIQATINTAIANNCGIM